MILHIFSTISSDIAKTYIWEHHCSSSYRKNMISTPSFRDTNPSPLRHHRLLLAGSFSPASHCPLVGSSATPHPLITRVSSAARPQCLQIGWVANRRWVGGRSTAECARDERARARQRAFSHQTMSIYPPCSCAPARPPAVPCVPVTVRAPFEDQPCPRGTKRNNRQIKVGQSARSLRVSQLSKRAC